MNNRRSQYPAVWAIRFMALLALGLAALLLFASPIVSSAWSQEFPADDSPWRKAAPNTIQLAQVAVEPSDRLAPQWLGRWVSRDGKRTMAITTSMIKYSDLRPEDDGTETWVHFGHGWSGAKEPANDGTPGFGYTKTSTSPTAIAARYEEALRQYRRDPTDGYVTEPNVARRAIGSIAPGTYRVMWNYGGGDCGEEYILDGDRMLEITTCKDVFAVRLFDRSR